MDIAELRERVSVGEAFDYLLFWGHRPPKGGGVAKTCMSQWYPAPFEVAGDRYATAEHWMMAGKARLFEDGEMFERILDGEDPSQAKKLGRKVRGFDDAVWRDARLELVTEGSVHKFEQNPALGRFLASTGTKVLVEASPYDRIWGIGMGASNEAAQDPRTWRGQNLLGFALMAARQRLAESS